LFPKKTQKKQLLDPAGRKSRADHPAQVVALQWTYARIHETYALAEGQCGNPVVTLKPFRRMWKKYAPWLGLMGKRTDFCNTCCDLKIKGEMLQLADHLKRAHASREFKNGNIKQTRASMNPDGKGTTLHLSFDYAQNVQLPAFADQVCGESFSCCRLTPSLVQPGEFYFQVGVKIAIFGIGDDARLQQTNYLLGEATADMGKGVDVTASMLFDYLITNPNARSAVNVIFNTDNCERHVVYWFI
jgi:hypothetical protein